MKVLLIGYYGFQNFGDDLLMKLSLDRLRHNPAIKHLGVTCLPTGIEYAKSLVPYVDRFEDVDNRGKYIQKYDVIIFGGGGTFFEYRKDLSRLFAFKKWFSDFRHFSLPKISGSRFASIGLGLGPFADSAGAAISLNRLKHHSIVFVRDSVSLKLAQAHHLNAVLSHDLSFLDYDNISALRIQTDQAKPCKRCVVVRNFKYGTSKNRYIDTLLDWARRSRESKEQIDWLSFQPQYDAPVISAVENAGFRVWRWDPHSMEIQDAYQKIAESSSMVTTRMHGTYVAGMLGIPCVSIGLHPKLEIASNYFENSTALSSEPSLSELEGAIAEVENQFATPPQITKAKEELQQMMDQLNDWIESNERTFRASSSPVDRKTERNC